MLFHCVTGEPAITCDLGVAGGQLQRELGQCSARRQRRQRKVVDVEVAGAHVQLLQLRQLRHGLEQLQGRARVFASARVRACSPFIQA